MKNDPIVEEVRKVREEHSARFNHDPEAIYRDLKVKEKQSGREYVRFEPNRLPPAQRVG